MTLLRLLLLVLNIVSSVKNETVVLLCSGRLLINTRYKNSVKLDSCGTPTSLSLEKEFSIQTLKDMSLGYDWVVLIRSLVHLAYKVFVPSGHARHHSVVSVRLKHTTLLTTHYFTLTHHLGNRLAIFRVVGHHLEKCSKHFTTIIHSERDFKFIFVPKHVSKPSSLPRGKSAAIPQLITQCVLTWRQRNRRLSAKPTGGGSSSSSDSSSPEVMKKA